MFKTDECAHYADGIKEAADNAEQLNKNHRAVFQYNRKAGLKLKMHKRYFGATEIDFLVKTNHSG